MRAQWHHNSLNSGILNKRRARALTHSLASRVLRSGWSPRLERFQSLARIYEASLWTGCEREDSRKKSRISVVRICKQKTLLLQKKGINEVVVICSQLLSFRLCSCFIMHSVNRLYGFTRECMSWCQDQTGCLTFPYLSRFDLNSCLNISHVCFSAGGVGWWWLDSSCLKLWNGERVMSEGYVLCVFMYTDSSQSRQIEGQPSHLWLFSSEELGCVWVYFQFIAAASHLWLLRTNWLGSGLGRLVALVEVSFPQLLWSFSPQNNFLNTETAEWMH